MFCRTPLLFLSEREVAGIAKAGHNVGAVVELGVNGSHPKGNVVTGEGMLQPLYALAGGYDTADVQFGRLFPSQAYRLCCP